MRMSSLTKFQRDSQWPIGVLNIQFTTAELNPQQHHQDMSTIHIPHIPQIFKRVQKEIIPMPS